MIVPPPPAPHLHWLVNTGAKLEALERAAAAGSGPLQGLLAGEGLTLVRELDVRTLPGSRAHGLGDDTLALAERVGWPSGIEVARFGEAVRACPLELIQAGLWEQPAAPRRRLARYVVAHRLHVLLDARDAGNPELSVASEILAEDLCREFVATRRSRLVDTDAGAELVDRLSRILQRIAAEREPPYLADALGLPPVHSYNTLRRFLRDFEVRRPHGCLRLLVRRVQDQGPLPRALQNATDHCGEAFVPFGAHPATRLPRAIARRISHVARRFFGERELLVRQILILKSLGVGTDAVIAAAVGLARETVNRRLSDVREAWQRALEAELTALDLDAYASAVQDWSGWAELVLPAAWPPLPGSLAPRILEAVMREHHYVRRFLSLPEQQGLAQRLVAGVPTDGLLEGLRAQITAFKIDVARSEGLEGDLTAFDAQFVYLLGGFQARGVELSHVGAAVRLVSGLGEDERALLACADATEEEKHRRLGGHDSYAELRKRLTARRQELERAIFPGIEAHWVTSPGPDGEPYACLSAGRVEEEDRCWDREQVFDAIVFLARERWRPY